jgi:hypothetical protein
MNELPLMSPEQRRRLGETLAIYEWQAWENFLLLSIFPRAQRVTAQIGEDHAEVANRVPSWVEFFVFHIDLTECSRIPLGRDILIENLRKEGKTLLNAHLTDISKKNVQSACLACNLPSTTASFEGDPDEILILKTDRNFGGEKDRLLKPEERRFLGLKMLEHSVINGAFSYQLCRRKKIPPKLWEENGIVIERYISNKRNVFFRAYVFLEKMVIEAAISDLPIKKTYIDLPRQYFYFAALSPIQGSGFYDSLNIGELPATLPSIIWQFCQHIRLEFGCVDVVMDDTHDCYVVDANSTPSWDRLGMHEVLAFLRSSLFEGSDSKR